MPLREVGSDLYEDLVKFTSISGSENYSRIIQMYETIYPEQNSNDPLVQTVPRLYYRNERLKVQVIGADAGGSGNLKVQVFTGDDPASNLSEEIYTITVPHAQLLAGAVVVDLPLNCNQKMKKYMQVALTQDTASMTGKGEVLVYTEPYLGK